MSFEGVITNKLNGGLGNTNPTDDRVTLYAHVVPTAALPAGTAHYGTYECLQLSDLESVGFNAAWDANNTSIVHSEVSEFFRLSPEGHIYFMPVPPALTPVELFGTAAFLTALKAVPKVKIIGLNGTLQTAATLAPLVEGVQAALDTLAAEHRLIDAVIIGAKGEDPAPAVAAYVDLRTKNAPNVSVSIAQDRGIVTGASLNLVACIGAVMGMLSIRRINENLGSVNVANKPAAKKGDLTYPLSFADKWVNPALSSGKYVSTLSLADMKALTEKGYIFAASYNGFPGVYFNDSPTCVAMASDYNRIENNCVWNKAARLIRTTMLPEVKGTVKKDPLTGNILGTTIARWENLLNKAFETQMLVKDEISGYSFYIDPKQTPNSATPLVIKARVVVDGIVHEFNVDLGLSNNV